MTEFSQMARRRYTEIERTTALELYRTDGPSAVEAKLGIPKGTVTGWARDAKVRTVRNERTAAATEAHRLDWEERRAALTHKIGETAELALDKAKASIGESHARNAKDYATTMAILVDKAQLLSGGATGRVFMDAERKAVVTDARDKALRLVS